jgi:mono/diheme cytochrome c family protein
MRKMIKKAGKWSGYGLLVLLGVALSAYGYACWNVQGRLNKVYPTHVPGITIPGDSASITRGEHLFVVHACRDCHGRDAGGKIVAEHPLVGRLVARNLTKGKGGLPAAWNDEDWLRTLKHGVDRQGRPLLTMPAHETTKIADAELADIIAYCKSLPPVDKRQPGQRLGPMLLAVVGLTEPVFFPAEKIDHALLPVAARQPQATAAYGEYLTTNCTACHREDFRGGPPLGPGYPPVPDISPTGRVGKWTEAEFMRTLRTGITPEGHRLDSTQMPWTRTRDFSDTELRAVRAFLLSLPAPPDLAARSDH